jgi:hypothetical protein
MSHTHFVTKIKNINLPNCINCVFFKKYNGILNGASDIEHKSICVKFGTKNLISGHVNYEPAIRCRNNAEMCGIDGKYFKPLM